jgi:hypothetical protein
MSDEYDDLFSAYVAALRRAKAEADAWWERAQQALPANGGADALQRRWPLGPAAHPRVIAVYRAFYLECEAITERRQGKAAEDARLVEPGTFVTEWLLEPQYTDLALMISQLPYAPLGLDEEGNTV